MPKKSTGVRGSRNSLLSKGIERLSRSASYSKKGKWAVKNKTAAVAKPAAKAQVTKPFGKNGQTRVIAKKTPRWYPADDVKRPLPSRKANAKPTKLRSTLTPGTVVILLAGRFRGKRAVFLKQLTSGLLLVSGPYKVNGVPLRRVNQAYVIATSTKVDVAGVVIPEKFNDSYFAKPSGEKKKKTEAEFFAEPEKKKTTDAQRIADQKAVDAPLLKAVQAVPQLAQYLGSRFTLKHGQFPHDLKF